MPDGTECPTCGRDDFASEQGMKAHHARSHGESLTTVVVECEVCGEEVEKDQHELENQEYVYCSQDCHYEHNSERYSGDGNPRSTLETVACANCGDELQRPKWRRELEDQFFCDFECMGEYRKTQYTAENNPHWKEYPTKECNFCGKAYKIKPSLADNQRFCSPKCQHGWQEESMSGSGNPRWVERATSTCGNCGSEFTVEQWQAGQREYCSVECRNDELLSPGPGHPRWDPDSKDDLYYGPNWQEQRRKAIVRDLARCQAPGCSVTEPESLRRFGYGLDVHHLTPFRQFKDGEIYDWREANKVNNLIALCCRCHSAVEDGRVTVSL